ncbi:MAG: hypothetical protein UHS51_12505 [Atopobiaceae bacterium]|nr:hypothetical protein [Atopobiaceae bacterium]
MYSETDARTLTSEAMSQAVERLKANAATMPAAKAVDKAIESMPGGFVIRPYLQAHKAEVRDMLLTEYDEAESMGSFRKEGHEKAAAGNLASLMRFLEQLGVGVERGGGGVRHVVHVFADEHPHGSLRLVEHHCAQHGIRRKEKDAKQQHVTHGKAEPSALHARPQSSGSIT